MHKIFLIISLFFAAHNSVMAEVLKLKQVDGAQVVVDIQPFNAAQHKLKYCGDYLCLVDGLWIFGTDGKVPKQSVRSIHYQHKGQSIPLNVEGLYNPNLNQENLNKRLHIQPYWGDFFKVTALLSDGAGSYVVQWTVGLGQSVRNFVGDSEQAFELTSTLQALQVER